MSKDELKELLQDPEIQAAVVKIISDAIKKDPSRSIIRQVINTSGGPVPVDRPMPTTPFYYPRHFDP